MPAQVSVSSITTATASTEQGTNVSLRAQQALVRLLRVTELAVLGRNHGKRGEERRAEQSRAEELTPSANPAVACAATGLSIASFGRFYWPGFVSASWKKSCAAHGRQADDSKLTGQHKCIFIPIMSLIFKAGFSMRVVF